MNSQPDFIAELQYRTTEEGGRKTPVFTGYRPQVKFAFSEMQTSGIQTFIDKETVYPGDKVIAEIIVLSTSFFEGSVEVGTSFEFREGSRVIGNGVIIEIRNPLLIKR